MKKKESRSLQEAKQRLHEILRRSGYKGKSEDLKRELPTYKINSEYPLSNKIDHPIVQKQRTQKYTGTELVGIGLMHKSNYVPIRKDSEEAKNIAKMK